MASTIVSAVDLWIPLGVTAAPDMMQKWETVLQALAELINNRRQARIPNEAKFNNILAEPAIQAWAGFANTAYRSKHGRLFVDIKNTHDINLQDAFENWKTKLDQVFATKDGVPAKQFKDQVSATKNLWGRRVRGKTLRLTGDAINGVGAATIASYWLIGEPLASGMLRPQDTLITGAPFRICPAEMEQSLQSALMQRLVQAGGMIFNSKDDPTIITRENTTNNRLVQGFVDPALGIDPFTPGGLSHLDFVKVGALMKLSLQVSRV